MHVCLRRRAASVLSCGGVCFDQTTTELDRIAEQLHGMQIKSDDAELLLCDDRAEASHFAHPWGRHAASSCGNHPWGKHAASSCGNHMGLPNAHGGCKLVHSVSLFGHHVIANGFLPAMA